MTKKQPDTMQHIVTISIDFVAHVYIFENTFNCNIYPKKLQPMVWNIIRIKWIMKSNINGYFFQYRDEVN